MGNGNNVKIGDCMTAKEVINLIDWLRSQGFSDDKIVECIEAVEGRKPVGKEMEIRPE